MLFGFNRTNLICQMKFYGTYITFSWKRLKEPSSFCCSLTRELNCEANKLYEWSSIGTTMRYVNFLTATCLDCEWVRLMKTSTLLFNVKTVQFFNDLNWATIHGLHFSTIVFSAIAKAFKFPIKFNEQSEWIRCIIWHKMQWKDRFLCWIVHTNNMWIHLNHTESHEITIYLRLTTNRKLPRKLWFFIIATYFRFQSTVNSSVFFQSNWR